MTRSELTAHRISAQLLSGPAATDAVGVVRHLLAVQAQDPRGARLAVRSRSTGLHASDVDRALTDDRSLLVSWFNRGTLHLVCTEDYWWLHALTTPQLSTAVLSRLRRENVSPQAAERGVAIIERALNEDGPQTRAQLRERVGAAGVPVQGQALVAILFLVTLRGICVRGPMVAGEQAFVSVPGWLGRPPREVDRDVALAELARRYLRGHGPANDRDLARWANLPLRDVRRGLRAIDGELKHRDDGLVELTKHRAYAPLPPPRLLGTFEPLLLGWCSRDPLINAHQAIVTVNGIFRAFALVDGEVTATWTMPAGHVEMTALAKMSPSTLAALHVDAVDVQRYLSV
jgi:hypothetical protein